MILIALPGLVGQWLEEAKMTLKNPTCPKCFSEFVKRVSSRSLAERFWCRICRYPFRCQICRFRFWVWQFGVAYAATAVDRREYERLAMNLPISFVGENGAGAGKVSDISINGCAFITEESLSETTVIRLALQISNELKPVEIQAAVVRHIRQEGRVGVEFLRMPPEERERLQLFIRGLRRE